MPRLLHGNWHVYTIFSIYVLSELPNIRWGTQKLIKLNKTHLCYHKTLITYIIYLFFCLKPTSKNSFTYTVNDYRYLKIWNFLMQSLKHLYFSHLGNFISYRYGDSHSSILLIFHTSPENSTTHVTLQPSLIWLIPLSSAWQNS